MCSPSATLTVWAGAWLSGRSAPDDVLDALRAWAPRQLVAAGDPVTGGHTGLPWPGGEALDRGARGRRASWSPRRRRNHDAAQAHS